MGASWSTAGLARSSSDSSIAARTEGGCGKVSGDRVAARQLADAGSIEQHGIELAVILAAATAVVMGSSCYDLPRKRG